MFEKQLKDALEAATLVAKTIVEIFHSQFEVEFKKDLSPVTIADKTADRIIREFLAKRYPNYDLLSEESIDDLKRLNNDYVWIIDPLDGTKQFVNHQEGFCTNIALSFKHEIVVGVVIVPLTGEIYYASKGAGSFYFHDGVVERLHVNAKENDLIVLKSVYHSNEKEEKLIAKHQDKIRIVETWGAALKPCRIAQGLAEISYRLSSGTKEWDTAAPQIIVEEAGGVFLKPNKEKILYNREDVVNREGYIICNKIENFLN